MTLAPDEFIRRFLLHVLPTGFHRIRHYGFLAGPGRAATIDRLRDLIAASDATARPRPQADASDATTGPEPATTQDMARICSCCGGRMRIIETFARGARPRSFTAESAGIELLMTAAPARAVTGLCSPSTSPGAAPFAPEPISATNVARHRAAETSAYANRPIPNPSDALASSASAPLRPPRAAPPSAKSP